MTDLETFRALMAEAKARDEAARRNGQIIVRGPGNPWFDAQMNAEHVKPSAPGHLTVPGRMTFTVLERK